MVAMLQKIDKATKPKWTQPREMRARKPIRFTPNELEVDAATGTRDRDANNKLEHPRTERSLPLEPLALPSPTKPPLETKPP